MEGEILVRMSNDELLKISGGFSLTFGVILGGIFTFLVGIFDGITRPLACR